jgi:signal transduction histidine kinase
LAIELAEVVAGFPAAASFAIAGGFTALREGRRRSSLNEAVHELRRPLQALALSLPADAETSGALDSSLRMAAAAVDRLEREINGGVPGERSARVALRPLVETAVERWQGRAARERRPLKLLWGAGDALLVGDGIGLGQTVDNMISNAFEHGRGEVVIEARERAGVLRLLVLDGGAPGPLSEGGDRGRLRDRFGLGGRARHGHGLRIVRRVAARHGGSFRLRRSPDRTEARLELPLTEGSR